MLPALALLLALGDAGAPEALDGGSPPDAGAVVAEPVLAQLRRMARQAEPTVQTPWVKQWLAAVDQLRPLPPRTFLCAKDRSRCLEPRQAKALPPRARAELVERVADDEFLYARIADPLGYTRALDLLGAQGFTPRGSRVLDFGYGNAGQLLMLGALGADVTGIEVDPLLPLALKPLVGPVKGGGRLRVLHGFFPKDGALVRAAGRGYSLFLSKNTLKRGYVHPSQPVPERQRIDLGVTDEVFLSTVAALLEPGGLFLIYNLCPAQAPPGQPWKPMADGHSPFTREALDGAGFEVLTFDAVDDEAARALGHALGWDREPGAPWDLEADLFALYTLARKR